MKIVLVLLTLSAIVFGSCSDENPLRDYNIYLKMPPGTDFKRVSTDYDELEVFVNFRNELTEILLMDAKPYRKRSQANQAGMLQSIKEKDMWYSQLLMIQKELIANKNKVKMKFKPLTLFEFPAYFSDLNNFQAIKFLSINKEYAMKQVRRNLSTNQPENRCDVVHYSIVNSKAYQQLDLHYVICGTIQRLPTSENFEKAVENAILLK
jgi:hypothetical protein